MKAMRILSAYLNLAKFFIAAAMICGIFQACSDDGEKDKDIFGFEGGSRVGFIFIIAISPKDELEFLQKEIDKINPRFKLYASVDNKNLLSFLDKDEKHSYISLYDKQGEKVIDYVGLVPEEMIEVDIRYQIQDQLDAKAQDEMQTFSSESQEEDEQNIIQPTEDSQESKDMQ